MRLYVCICAYLKIHITKIKKKEVFNLRVGVTGGVGGGYLGWGWWGGSDNSILIKMCLLKRKKKAKYLFFSGVFSPGQTAAWITNSNNLGFTSFTS